MLTTDELSSMRTTVAGLFTDAVIRRRFGTTTDEYNNVVRGVATDVSYLGRLVQQSSREVTTDRDTQITEWALLLPHDADVIGSDQLLSGVLTFEAIGPPVHKPSPGASTHARVNLRYIKG